MKVAYKIAMLASSAIFLGAIPVIAQETSQPSLPSPVFQECAGGGYPIPVCEIVNGRRVCHRHCP